MNKPIFYYHVNTSNRGDMAIRKSIVDAISDKINVSFAFFNVKYEELTEERIVNQLNPEGACLMIAGSGLYTNYPMSSGWYFPCKTELFDKIKVPIILFGLGCNNNIGKDIFDGDLKKETKNSILKINELSSYSTVRDERTYNLLRRIGIKNHQLMLDPANFLKVNCLPKEKRVVINLAQHSPTLGRFDGGKEGRENREKNIKYFAEISKYLINKGYKIIFIAHDALESSIISDLKKLVPTMEYLNTDNIDKMLEEYSRCEFSIGCKMHSNILSFASGTPFISIYYDVKSIEYAKLVYLDNFQLCIFDDYLEELKIKTNVMIENIEYLTNDVNNIREYHKLQFNKGIKKICDIVQIIH